MSVDVPDFLFHHKEIYTGARRLLQVHSMGADQTAIEIRKIKNVLYVAAGLIVLAYCIALLVDVVMTENLGITIDTTVFTDPSKLARLIATMATSITAAIILAGSAYRYKVKRKTAPLLLSCTFLFFTAGYVVYWFKMIVKFVEAGAVPPRYLLLSNMFNNGIWLLLLPGALFLLFFVFEVFEGGLYATKNRVPVRVFFAFLVICFGLIVLSTYNDQFGAINTTVMDILLYVGFGFGLITFIYTFVVQLVSASKILDKTEDKVQRTGILFIGLSGLMFLANIALELLEQLSRALDIGIENLTDPLSVVSQFLSLVASILVYVGFIYPSLKGKQA